MPELSEIYNYLPMSDSLLTSGQPTEEQFKTIAEAGVKAIINLAPATSPNALPNEPEIVRGLGMQHFHIPVLWSDPSEEVLTKFMDTMDSLDGQKVFVHCAANMRVSTFLALYRIVRLGWEERRAFREVYRLWNPFEETQWKKFIEAVLQKKK
jgi:protein tyrosine phosphatase (PTP) superfamily phosphohydrolase (DUF442 family)